MGYIPELHFSVQSGGYALAPHAHKSGFFLYAPDGAGTGGGTDIDQRVFELDCKVYFPGIESGYYINFVPALGLISANAPNCIALAKHFGPPENFKIFILNVAQNPNSSGDYIEAGAILGDIFVYRDWECALIDDT